MEDKYCTHDKKIKSRKCEPVVVKEVVINILWLDGNLCCCFLITIGTVYALLSICFFKDVVKTKCTILYYYRYVTNFNYIKIYK